MPPSRSSGSKSSDVVFFTYRCRKVVFARPGTYEDAVNLVKKTWTPLKAITPERLCISARLPGHAEEGVVEIAPDAWQLATNGVKQFTVGIVDEDGSADEDVKREEATVVKKEEEEDMPAPKALQPLRSLPFDTPPSTAGHSRLPHTLGSGSRAFSVFVQSRTGKVYRITDLHSTDNIHSVKRKLEDASAVPVGQQRLIFGGKQLEDNRTLADCSITSRSTLYLVLRLRGGKPVIYLFPHTHMSVKVQLSLVPQWSFSAVYPKPIEGSFREGKSSQTAEWDVIASPTGMMTVEGSTAEVAYLFWEAETESSNDLPESPPMSRSPSPLPEVRPELLRPRAGFIPGHSKCSPHDSVVLSVHSVPLYLEKALLALGLHTEARTSFITYWLPSLLKHENLALRFVSQADYEAAAPLNITPKPDIITRVFMLFEGIPTDKMADWEEARQRSLVDATMWKGIVGVEETRQSEQNLFRVLEWGGMEVQ